MKRNVTWVSFVLVLTTVFLLRIPELRAATPRFQQVEPSVAAKAVANLRTSTEFKAFLKDLGPGFHAEAGGAVFGQEDYLFVAVPIAYRGKHEGANYTLVLNRSDLSLVEATAMKVTPTPLGYSTQFWRNGSLLADLTVDDHGTILSGWRSVGDNREDLAGKNLVQQGRAVVNEFFSDSDEKSLSLADFVGAGVANADLRCLNNCLASAGLPTFLLTVVAAVCALACVGTFGFGCYVCTAAVLGGYAGILTACLRQCGYWA